MTLLDNFIWNNSIKSFLLFCLLIYSTILINIYQQVLQPWSIIFVHCNLISKYKFSYYSESLIKKLNYYQESLIYVRQYTDNGQLQNRKGYKGSRLTRVQMQQHRSSGPVIFETDKEVGNKFLRHIRPKAEEILVESL